MSKRTFAKLPPLELLLNLCELNFIKVELLFYLIEPVHFQTMVQNKAHQQFLEDLIPYYQPSKRHFATRPFSYNSFANIIRQICHVHKHQFKTKIHYEHTTPSILYYVSLVV